MYRPLDSCTKVGVTQHNTVSLTVLCKISMLSHIFLFTRIRGTSFSYISFVYQSLDSMKKISVP